jgi:hypothetical protein
MKKEKLVKVNSPKRNAEPASLSKYRKWKKIYKYYSLKKELGVEVFSSGDEAKLKRAESRMKKSRKLAAPMLIQKLRAKKAAFGRGKKRGGVGGNLSKLK